jgi:hypothetical protein
MLLFTVGGGKKPGDSGNSRTRPEEARLILNDNYLRQNLKK